MGIPKFFRYVAQRWPLVSQQVNDNVIPEFDNLYLDMNSILHTATHNNVANLGNLSEDQMYMQICNYIEHLFAIIAPRKVLFMAIDGVAPRAKMNQQRARRFRSAMDAEVNRRKAAENGEILDEDPFDSNCITPGTEFMARLTQRLRYFIARKITEDTLWQRCTVVLSGHEVPGEGEHKIMRFIRSLRSEPDFDPNTRHCLYGLDADLIMLGLSSHEPHFALLREEVTFGRQVRFQSAELSEKRFILMQLSLVREYIQIELRDKLNPNPPEFERMIDDFVLINFFIGNDFLPELPMLMVNEGAIPVIFDTYKTYLRESGNRYLSKNGQIDFMALKEWMDRLKIYQVRKFEETSKDLRWFNERLSDVNAPENEDILILTVQQREIFDEVAPFMLRAMRHPENDPTLKIKVSEPKFIELLAEQTGFEYKDGTLHYVNDKVDQKLARKVIRIYDNAHVNDPASKQDYAARFEEWKNRYYNSKFGDISNSEIVAKTAIRYLEGLQWVLYYYYRGCPSWSWYYDNHYAPMTTEIISAISDGFTPEFHEGVPFRPFEQLMSVLPDRSAKLLPPVLRPLVLEPTSPIIDFYPHEFSVDKNGKRADWEAVVLIPFIDQNRLLKYVKPIEDSDLTPAEQQRNSRGLEYEFSFDPNAATLYKAPTPSLMDIPACTSVVKTLTFPKREIRYGLLDGAVMGAKALAGFPSLYTLPFDWKIAKDEGVKVFEMPSRDESVIISLKKAEHPLNVGNRVFVNWPFLSEAEITQILAPSPIPPWSKDLPRITDSYKRVGVKIGETEALVRVRHLQGLRRQGDGSYTKEFGGDETVVPAQLVVPTLANEDERYSEKPAVPIDEEFPLDSSVLLLLAKYYGFPAKVISHKDNQSVDVEVLAPRARDPLFTIGRSISETERAHIRWSSTDQVAKSLNLPVKFLLQLTSRLIVEAGGDTYNITLPLRKHGLGLMAEGYTRLGYRGMWEFSDRGIALLLAYLREFRDVFAKLRVLEKGAVSAKVANDMRTWVREHTEQIAFMPTSTNHLTHQSIAAIEDKVVNMPPTHLEKVAVKGVDRAAVLSPKHAHHELRSQSFKLGDRVVSALSFGKVPLYMRGIVVGVNGGTPTTTTLDVLWDHEFAAASTLDGRTKTKRGLTVQADSVLNISMAQLTHRHDQPAGRQFVSARVNTRSTPATGGLRPKGPAQSKSFAPAESRNDWAAAKQIKTNASGHHLLQALGGPVKSVPTRSVPTGTYVHTGYATAAGDSAAAPASPVTPVVPIEPIAPAAPKTKQQPTAPAMDNKDSGRQQKPRKPRNKGRSAGQVHAAEEPAKTEIPQQKQSLQQKQTGQKHTQQKQTEQNQNQPKQTQPKPKQKQKSPGASEPSVQIRSDPKTAPAPVDSKSLVGQQSHEPQQEHPAAPAFTLPNVKGNKPPSAESAKLLLDTLMLKK